MCIVLARPFSPGSVTLALLSIVVLVMAICTGEALQTKILLLL